LVNAGFNVTAVQRKESTNPVPEGLKSVKVDLTNKDELVSVFTGQDAVVRYASTISANKTCH
jgi:putative NADH-flavin reductase